MATITTWFNPDANENSMKSIKTIHKGLASILYLLTKLNLVIGSYRLFSTTGLILLFVYLGFLAYIYNYLDSWYKASSIDYLNISSIEPKASEDTKHKQLIKAISEGKSREEII